MQANFWYQAEQRYSAFKIFPDINHACKILQPEKKKKNLKIMKIYLSCTTTLFQHILLLHTYLLWSRLSSFFLPYKFSLIDSFIHSLASPSLPYLHILSIYLIFLPLLFMYLCMFLSFFLSFRCRASRLWIGMIGYGGVSGV